jgi:hypothetical protein
VKQFWMHTKSPLKMLQLKMINKSERTGDNALKKLDKG